MNQNNKLQISLLFLRVSVFLVMFMWAIDKFINPQHASTVYAKFYYIGDLQATPVYIIGAIEIVLLLMFLAGVMKKYTYGAVLILHTISTVSSFKQYLAPFDGYNLMFFAAWPMLAACFALFMLRDLDTRFTLK